jgi:endoglycosylceramidase
MLRYLVPLLLLCSRSAAQTDPCDATVSVGAGGAFTDACGRLRVFHGINAVAKSPPYVPLVGAGDAALWGSLGLNAVRFGVMWAGVEPVARGNINHTYLAALAGLQQTLYHTAGIFAVLDAHQDGFSEFFCDDGAPAWAAAEYSAGAAGFPEPLAPALANASSHCSALSGIPWAELYLTSAVGRAFQVLYNTSQGQADFGRFWGAVAGALGQQRGVLGYELLNEPWCGDALADPLLLLPGVADATLLQPFYASATASLRAAEAASGSPARIVLSEPITWSESFPVGFSELPGGPTARALAYHYYSAPDIIGYAAQVAARAADASRLGAGGMLTEFDLNLQHPVLSPYTTLDLRGTMDAAEAAGHSWLAWEVTAMQADGGAGLHIPTVRELARPYARAVAGVNATSRFAVAAAASPGSGSTALTGNYTLSYQLSGPAAAAGAATEVVVSTGLWWEGAGLAVAASPPGLLQWQWRHLPGAVSLPGANATSLHATAFAQAVLTVTLTAQGAAAAGGGGAPRVTLVVSGSG